MGLSRGGRAAVNSSVTRFQTMHAPAGLRFAAHIGLYTPCDTVYRGDDDVAAPILLLHGTADTYVSIEPCRSYASRLAAAGKDIRLIEYEGAGHVFDAPDLVTPVMLPKAQTTRHCRMIEGDDGVILNQDTQQAFSYGDACVEHGPTIAYNGAADRKALADITAFLERVFALK